MRSSKRDRRNITCPQQPVLENASVPFTRLNYVRSVYRGHRLIG